MLFYYCFNNKQTCFKNIKIIIVVLVVIFVIAFVLLNLVTLIPWDAVWNSWRWLVAVLLYPLQPVPLRVPPFCQAHRRRRRLPYPLPCHQSLRQRCQCLHRPKEGTDWLPNLILPLTIPTRIYPNVNHIIF